MNRRRDTGLSPPRATRYSQGMRRHAPLTGLWRTFSSCETTMMDFLTWRLAAALRRAFRFLAIVAALELSWSCHSHACAQEPGGLAAAAAIQDTFVKVIESAEKSVV